MKLLEKFYPIVTGIVVFIVYLTTMCPTVTTMDCGELATCQALIGVSHPTGYPLFTLTGYLFLKIFPFNFTPIYKLNLLNAFWAAAGIVFFIYLIKNIFSNIENILTKKKINQELTEKEKQSLKNENVINIDFSISDEMKKLIIAASSKYKIVVSLLGGLFLAFSKTYWTQSTSVEVYAFSYFLFILSIYFFFNYYFKKDKSKYLYFFSAAFGLAVGSHLTSLLILIPLSILFITKYGINKSSVKILSLSAVIFIVILLLQYYSLYLIANSNPVLNWGGSYNLPALIKHITAAEYKVYLFYSFESFQSQLTYVFLSVFPNYFLNHYNYGEFTISIVVIFIGIFFGLLFLRKFSFLFLLYLVVSIFTTVIYCVIDIDFYLTAVYIILAIFLSFGILSLSVIKTFKKNFYQIIIPLFVFLLSIQLLLTYDEVDQSKNYFFNDYAKEALNSLDSNSILVTDARDWVYFTAAAYYFQYAEKFRKDVIILVDDQWDYPWYQIQIRRNYPQLFDSTGKLNFKNRSIYLHSYTLYKPISPVQNYFFQPDLFFFKAADTTIYHQAKLPNYNLRFFPNKNFYNIKLELEYGYNLLKRAEYELVWKKFDRAKIYYEKVKNELPHLNLPPHLKKVFEEKN